MVGDVAKPEDGGGSIVCRSSISEVAGQKRQSTYGPAKFVASGLAKHLAAERADRGIRVDAVAPGGILPVDGGLPRALTYSGRAGCLASGPGAARTDGLGRAGRR